MPHVAPMKGWIEIELKDEVIKQMLSERFEIKLPDGKVRKGRVLIKNIF